MLRLYHYWSSVCSQKVRMCLAEKRLDWESRHVDIFAFENYEPAYTSLNPKAVVPTLDHDGNILIESNIILEYLEDVFPDAVRLRPDDPFARSTMRLWIYNSEELAHWNVNVCSHNLRHAKRMDQRYSHEEQLAAAMKCPNPMIALRLKRRLAVGVSVEEEDEAYAKLDYLLDQMEQRLLQGPWIAGTDVHAGRYRDGADGQPHRGAGAAGNDRAGAPAEGRGLVAAHSGAAGIPDGVLVQEPRQPGSSQTLAPRLGAAELLSAFGIELPCFAVSPMSFHADPTPDHCILAPVLCCRHRTCPPASGRSRGRSVARLRIE